MQTETGARHHTGVDEANGIRGWPSPRGEWEDGFQSDIIRVRRQSEADIYKQRPQSSRTLENGLADVASVSPFFCVSFAVLVTNE